MATRDATLLVRFGSPLALALVLALVLAACTPGGQFDPTTLMNSSVFETKKKIQGQREPLFPNGVPGAETGVPPDLVKGYKPPPEQADADTSPDGAPAGAPNAGGSAPATQAVAPPKPKPKPKPKLARAPAPPQDAAFDQKPPTRIDVGRSAKPAAPAAASGDNSQSVWPASPQTAPAQQTAQPAQSVWPNPPATGTSTQ